MLPFRDVAVSVVSYRNFPILLKFVLYSRTYCHLCEDMLHALQQYRNSFQFSIEVVDVDSNELLLERFDELVPVLFGQKEGRPPIQLCHYFLDTEKLELFLNE